MVSTNSLENKIVITLQSKMENISLIRNMIGVIVMDKNPTLSFINELKTSVSEAVTNSIVHGYNKEEDHEVRISVALTDEEVKVEVSDSGIGIEDIEQAKIPMFTTKAIDDRSGLGFTIMEVFSDDFFCYSTPNEGTRVVLVKKF